MAKKIVHFEWHGKKVEAKAKRAIESASVQWGVTVAQKAKGIVHRLSGTLSRSLHAAPDNYNIDDTAAAMVSTMPLEVGNIPRWVGSKAMVAAGSWIDYAIYEKARGGLHDFLSTPARETNSKYGDMLRRAFARQGLK